MSDIYPTDPAPNQVFIEAQSSIGEAINPYTLQSQTTTWGGEQYIVTLQYPPLERTQIDKVVGFLQGMRQQPFLFDFPMGNATDAVYTRTVAPVVGDDTRLQVTGSFKTSAGAYFSVGGTKIYKFLEDFNVADSALAKETIKVWPRVTTFTSSVVDPTDPIRGWFRLHDYSSIGWTHELANIGQFQVKLRSFTPLVV